MSSSTVMVPREAIEALAREYRPSMDKDTVHDWGADAAAMLKRLAASPQQSPISGEGARLAFGLGRFVVDTGSYNQTPAVFICPVDKPGEVGASARSLGHDRNSLQPGEIVLTFPFFAQAQAVADALVTAPPVPSVSGVE